MRGSSPLIVTPTTVPQSTRSPPRGVRAMIVPGSSGRSRRSAKMRMLRSASRNLICAVLYYLYSAAIRVRLFSRHPRWLLSEGGWLGTGANHGYTLNQDCLGAGNRCTPACARLGPSFRSRTADCCKKLSISVVGVKNKLRRLSSVGSQIGTKVAGIGTGGLFSLPS